MAEPAQSYRAHRRFRPPYHFFVAPVLLINSIVQLVRLVREPSGNQAWAATVAIALFVLGLTARAMSLTVQNRVVRLEERLRLQSLMPGEQATVAALDLPQLIGLRFASDEEAPELARRCASGELKTSGDIKRLVKHWRSDHLRV
jgi:hypothetical protein